MKLQYDNLFGGRYGYEAKALKIRLFNLPTLLGYGDPVITKVIQSETNFRSLVSLSYSSCNVYIDGEAV